METAIIISGSSQYMVKVGKIIDIQKINGNVGDVKDFSDLLNDQKVKGEIIAQFRSPKLRVFKFKNKTGYRRTKGHRQNLTKFKIISIGNHIIQPEKIKKIQVTKTKEDKKIQPKTKENKKSIKKIDKKVKDNLKKPKNILNNQKQ